MVTEKECILMEIYSLDNGKMVYLMVKGSYSRLTANNVKEIGRRVYSMDLAFRYGPMVMPTKVSTKKGRGMVKGL